MISEQRFHIGIREMGISLSHLLIVMLIVLILFGAGKLPQVMSDLAKGIKSFKDGLKDTNVNNNDEDKIL